MPLQRIITIIIVITLSVVSCSKKGTPNRVVIQNIETAVPILTPVTLNVNACIGGFYSGVPASYNNSSDQYPLLVFLHGGGQFGNGNLDLPLLLNEGITELLDEKLFPPDFNVNGKHFSFIVLAPQFRREPTNEEVHSFISFAIQRYRIDTTRMYLTGMSNGGKITCNAAAAYPFLFSAIVAMSGVADSVNIEQKCQALAGSDLPMWVFHNDSDQVIPLRGVKRFLSLMDSLQPKTLPRFTEFSSAGLLGHDSWTRATDPAYKEENQNIYEWMLQFHK